MTKQQYEYYNWGQDVKRVFAGVPMDDAFDFPSFGLSPFRSLRIVSAAEF